MTPNPRRNPGAGGEPVAAGAHAGGAEVSGSVEFVVVGNNPEWTDEPRDLTEKEIGLMREAIQDEYLTSGRLRGIKLYRSMTCATLKAAVLFVDAIRNEEHAARAAIARAGGEG